MSGDLSPHRVALLGATGFVGKSVLDSLEARGCAVRQVRAPRLAPRTVRTTDADDEDTQAIADLRQRLSGTDVVVNCAGNPDASSRDEAALMSVNATLPGLVASVAVELGIPRFVHVSSAVVQGRRPCLDQTLAYDSFSAYSRSKAVGETWALARGAGRTVVYRPPSVHALDRRVTRSIARLARSPLATVASPTTAPSPQAHITNVGSAVAFLACTSYDPPAIVIHPWEGLTTGSLLRDLGEKEPLVIPRAVAKVVSKGLKTIGSVFPYISANARRLDMIWFGQDQAESWLTEAGWVPPTGPHHWREMGHQLAQGSNGGLSK